MRKLLLIIFLITISCSNNKVITSHGSNALEIKINKIVTAKSNKNDIIKILGKPSTTSMFDKNIWYYIERKTITQSPFKLGKAKIIKNDILEINFDNYGIVKSKKLYIIDDMNKLKIEQKITEKEHGKQDYIDKVLSSVKQKINAPKNKKK